MQIVQYKLTDSLAEKTASFDLVAVLTAGGEVVSSFGLLVLGEATASSSVSAFEKPAKTFLTDFEPLPFWAVFGPKLVFGSGRFLFLGN